MILSENDLLISEIGETIKDLGKFLWHNEDVYSWSFCIHNL